MELDFLTAHYVQASLNNQAKARIETYIEHDYRSTSIVSDDREYSPYMEQSLKEVCLLASEWQNNIRFAQDSEL